MKKLSFMKKTIPFHLKSLGGIFLLALFSITYSRCTKENIPDSAKSQGNTVESFDEFELETEDKYENMVKTAAIGLIELAKNASFRSHVNSLVAEQFDGDDNTLLITLKEELENESINLASEFQSSINTWKSTIESIDVGCNSKYKDASILTTEGDILESINGFEYSEEETFYIQIYIPFADKVNLNSCPVIALGIDDECETDGYIICGEQEISCMTITKEFAEENLVWVISVNEVVDNDGKLPEANEIEEIMSGGNNSDISFRTVYDNTVRISKIKITDKKECWLCGKAEVSIIMPAVTYNTCTVNMVAYSNCFKKVGKDDVNDILSVSQVLYPSQDYGTNYRRLRENEDVGWILFEKDASKKSYKKESSIPSCSANKYTYYSKQTAYGIEPYFALGARNNWNWHEEGMFTYPGDVNTPAGSGISFEMKRVE